MKSVYFYLNFLFFFSSVCHGQLRGVITLDSVSLPGVNLKFEKSNIGTQSDFDGEFELPINSKADNLIISYNGLNLKVLNFDLFEKEIDIGRLEMPFFKSIEIEEFNTLSDLRRKDCLPIRHWTQLLGYFDISQLQKETIKFNCQNNITDFSYKSETKTISVNWKVIENCLNE